MRKSTAGGWIGAIMLLVLGLAGGLGFLDWIGPPIIALLWAVGIFCFAVWSCHWVAERRPGMALAYFLLIGAAVGTVGGWVAHRSEKSREDRERVASPPPRDPGLPPVVSMDTVKDAVRDTFQKEREADATRDKTKHQIMEQLKERRKPPPPLPGSIRDTLGKTAEMFRAYAEGRDQTFKREAQALPVQDIQATDKGWVSSPYPDLTFARRYVVQVNVPIDQLTLVFISDKPIGICEAELSGKITASFRYAMERGTPERFYLQMAETVNPENPLIVTLAGKEKFECEVKRYLRPFPAK